MNDDNLAGFTFEAYVLACFSRIHAVACDQERSYEGYAHQSAIDQLYYSIPNKRKKKKYTKVWDQLQEDSAKLRGIPELQREQENIRIVGEKMQLVADIADDLNLLFTPPNPVLEMWYKKGRELNESGV